MLGHCVGVGGKGGILRLEKRELVRIGCEGGGHKVGRQAGGEGQGHGQLLHHCQILLL